MKRYTVTHAGTAEPLPGFHEELRVADQIAKSLGDDFTTTAWIGFGSIPLANCVFRDDGQLETICLYEAEANKIAKMKNEREPGRFSVRKVLVNTAYPHAHGEYSV